MFDFPGTSSTRFILPGVLAMLALLVFFGATATSAGAAAPTQNVDIETVVSSTQDEPDTGGAIEGGTAIMTLPGSPEETGNVLGQDCYIEYCKCEDGKSVCYWNCDGRTHREDGWESC